MTPALHLRPIVISVRELMLQRSFERVRSAAINTVIEENETPTKFRKTHGSRLLTRTQEDVLQRLIGPERVLRAIDDVIESGAFFEFTTNFIVGGSNRARKITY